MKAKVEYFDNKIIIGFKKKLNTSHIPIKLLNERVKDITIENNEVFLKLKNNESKKA